MIALNETNEYAAEVPFTLPLASNPLTGLTGWTFTLGEVQIRLPGASTWTNVAVNKIVEKGYGRFCVRLTASQCTTAGIVAIQVNVADAQPYFGYETIGTLGGDVGVNSSDSYILFFLPNEIDPIYSAPVDSADFNASGTLRICLPDDVYRDCTSVEKSSVINLGYGGYALPLNNTLTAKAGKIFIYAEYPSAQRFEGYVTVLGTGVSASPGEVEGTPTTPIEVPLVAVSPQSTYKDLIDTAVGRLCQFSRSGDFDYGDFVDNVGGENIVIPLGG